MYRYSDNDPCRPTFDHPKDFSVMKIVVFGLRRITGGLCNSEHAITRTTPCPMFPINAVIFAMLTEGPDLSGRSSAAVGAL